MSDPLEASLRSQSHWVWEEGNRRDQGGSESPLVAMSVVVRSGAEIAESIHH